MKVVQKFYPPSTTIVILLLLQRVENVPETFLEKWAWPPVSQRNRPHLSNSNP